MTDRITYTEAAKILGVPLTTLRALRKRIGAPESVVVTSGTQPAMFSKREYEEFALDHNVKALIAAERHFDKHGVYPNQGDAKPTFNKLAFTFLKGAYLPEAEQVKREALISLAKRNKPKTTRVTVESDWAMKSTDANSGGRIRSTTQLKADGLPVGIYLTRYNTYRAKIKYNKVEYNLGSYLTLEEAVKARQLAEEQIRNTGSVSIVPSDIKEGLPKGIQFRKHGVYRVRIKRKGVDYHLGEYKTLEEAMAVRTEAERQIKETGRVK